MKITAVNTEIVTLRLPTPVATAIHKIDSLSCVLLRLHTDQGLIGESYLFTLNPKRVNTFDAMLKSLSDFVIGQNPHYVAAIRQGIWAEINPSGRSGVAVSALSCIDTACWDLIGKSADKPLHHIFGACRDRVKTYASGGLWLSQSIDELTNAAEQFIQDGFRAMKMRVGADTIAEDVARVRAVREAIGDDVELMADVNQRLLPKRAIQLGRALAEFQLAWLEEPVDADDAQGAAQVTAALDTPIACGENAYTSFAMQQLTDARACDIITPDLQRIGGLSEMLRVAGIAAARRLPLSTHMFTEQSLCVAGAAPNCISVEHMPWFAGLFNESLDMINGELLIPQRPGTGFTFNKKILNARA